MEIKKTRNIVQGLIAFLLLYEGYQFYLFQRHFKTLGATPYVPRPPAVEAFLPISALVSLKSWVSLGIFDTVHPAGLVIFIAIMGTAFIFGRPFCSWLCPVGLVSEGLWEGGKSLLGKNPRIPKVIDYSLMTIKYVIMIFFLKVILIDMPGEAAYAFSNAPYNKVVDVKMLDFWIAPTSAVIKWTVALVLLSIVFKNFWCRYICPYGALLGILGRFAPLRIKRHEDVCINCSLCTKNCPSFIDVENKDVVTSVECIKCLTCIEKCPEPGALDIRAGKHVVEPLKYAAAFLGLFFLVIIIGKLTGHWHSSVTYEEYRTLIPMSDVFSH
jgi:polyferredoxin